MPWDFSRPEKRDKARRMVREQKPYVLIGSPECRAFSTWQALNAAKSMDPDKLKREKTKATLHLNFMISLYEEQIEAGKYFLHEHPRFATSWQLRNMEILMQVRALSWSKEINASTGHKYRQESGRARPS